MATIWDNDWVNGAVNMAPVLPVRKCTWHGVSNTSAESVSPSLRWESGSLRVGDEILVTGPTTGAVMQTVDEIRVDLKPVEETVKGERFSIKMSEKIRPSDRLYKMEKVQIEKELQ